MTALSVWRSGQLSGSVPVVVVDSTWYEAAVDAAGRLTAAGARAHPVCGWCERTVSPGAGPLGAQPCASENWPTERCPPSGP
ncbi:hypothetical protein [Streptomyces sp. NPDC005209]|uniref:hypothetical protein n=1 Tax=Streptomyces sp. NPDC005209 TaxID=3156715 RepID=UPI0033BD501E